MYLFIDTETTGFAHTSKPVDHPDQPAIVQLGAITTEFDGTERNSLSLIVNSGIPSKEGALAVHGIDEHTAARCGVLPSHAASALSGLCKEARIVVFHNSKFDLFVLETMFRREAGMPWPFDGKTIVCTMQMAKENKALSNAKLGDVYEQLFGTRFENSHDALADCRACMKIYFHLKRGGQ